ncbi:MAG: ornithine--oxo-acid transaminase [Gammaproteobacteria bacterium]|nr:ornithine--oxo-acid transaminase [Gammaproteobacteria bacterium]
MFDLITATDYYCATNVAPYPLVISKGEGSYVYDFNGKPYIDMLTGIAVGNFGHGHPRLLKALTEQATKLTTLSRLFYNEPLHQLLERICPLTGMDKALPMNSGAEAVETAIKVARKWAYTVKGVAPDEAEIIVCNDNFHGRTIATISMSSVDKYKDNFGPLTPGFKQIAFNDSVALEQAITPNTAAFIVEPIQGEAGIAIPDKGYLQACQKLCKENNVLFIIDEIQTGMGRTGKLLASQHEEIEPDGILLGKALGGGMLPISLFLAKAPILGVIQPGDHGSTFGGNPLASFVAFEAINVLIEENLCQQSAELGQYFLDQLKTIKSPIINEVRGKGLFMLLGGMGKHPRLQANTSV